jgi:hypothetical protein
MKRSRIEFLKAVRALVDDRIESLEKKSTAKGKKKITRVDVE